MQSVVIVSSLVPNVRMQFQRKHSSLSVKHSFVQATFQTTSISLSGHQLEIQLHRKIKNIVILQYQQLNFEYLSGCACIPTVKKHAFISEGVLIFECFVQ